MWSSLNVLSGSIIDLYVNETPAQPLTTQIGKPFDGPFSLITYVFISAASLFMLSAPVRGCALVCINNRNISDLVLIAIQQPEGGRDGQTDGQDRTKVETDGGRQA